MSHSNSATLLPSGVRHHSTMGFADTWHTWDRLLDRYEHDEDWRLERRFNSETGQPTEWLVGVVDGCEVVVHQPLTAPLRVTAEVDIRVEDFDRSPYHPSMEERPF